MDKILEKFNFHTASEEALGTLEEEIEGPLRDASDPQQVQPVIAVLSNKLADPNFPKKDSVATKAVDMVLSAIRGSDIEESAHRKLQPSFVEMYIICWTAGPTSGHIECMPEIRQCIDDYVEKCISREEMMKLIEALKLNFDGKKIEIDEDYIEDLKDEFERVLCYTVDESEYEKHFEDWVPLYNHYLTSLSDRGEGDQMNKIMTGHLEAVQDKLEYEKRWKEVKDKSLIIKQLQVYEEVARKIGGTMEFCRKEYRAVEDGFRHVIDVLKAKTNPASDIVSELTEMLFKMFTYKTDLSTRLAAIISRNPKNNKWPAPKGGEAVKHLPKLVRAADEADWKNIYVAQAFEECYVYVVKPTLTNGDLDKPLFKLLDSCMGKRNYYYLRVFDDLMDKKFDKLFKWKTNVEGCKKILQTVLSLENVHKDVFKESDYKDLHSEMKRCMRDFVEKFEKYRTQGQLSGEMAQILERAVAEKSKIHLHAVESVYDDIVWKNNNDILVNVLTAVCNYIKTPDEFSGNITEFYSYLLQSLLRAVIELKLEARVADFLLATLENCLDKPYVSADDPDEKTVYFHVANSILSEFCYNIMEKAEVASPFVPLILKINVMETEDDFGEELKESATSITRWMGSYGKTMGEHADLLIDTKAENDQTEGLIGMALAVYPDHPDKIIPRLDSLIDIADDDNQTDLVQIIQLLHMVAKKNPELWNDKMHKKVLNGLETDNYFGMVLYCMADVYQKHPSRMIDDLDLLMPYLKNEPIQLNMLYQVLPQVAEVKQDYALKILSSLDELLASIDDIQTQNLMLMSYRSIANSHRDLVAKRRAVFEEKKEISALSQNAGAILDFLDGKSLDNVYEELDEKGKDIDKLDTRVTKTEDDVDKVTKKVDKHGRDLEHIKEDVTKAEVKLDVLTDTVEEMGEKVEEIDHKTLNHAPAWSRDVSILLNPESKHDWRLLAQRLGYSNDDIRGWATQADPCMAMLNEWFATHKTSEAVHGVYKALTEMNRTDAAAIVKKAIDKADNIIEEDEEDTGEPPPVFISYQWGHQPEVKLLKRHLDMAGYTSWMDIGQMGGGDKLFSKIDQGMRAAKVVICCVTDKYAKSDNCTREVNLAVTLGKPIIPLLMEKSKWPPEGAMGPIFGEYLFIRFWQRGAEVTPDDDQRYWPLMKFSELLMQIRLYIAPDLDLLTDLYKDWCNPAEEDIEIKSKPKTNKDGKEDKQGKTEAKATPQSSTPDSQVPQEISPDVFISYQWGKQPQIRKLYCRLSGLGFSCWMDIHQMGGGDSLYEKIDKGIRGCKVVICCCTRKYSLSANCRREVSLADALKKPIVPILLEEMPWPPEGAMSMVFTQLLYINFSKDLNLQEIWSGDLFDQLILKITQHAPAKMNDSDREISSVSTGSEQSKHEGKVKQAKSNILSHTNQLKSMQSKSGKSNVNAQSKGAKTQLNKTQSTIPVSTKRGANQTSGAQSNTAIKGKQPQSNNAKPKQAQVVKPKQEQSNVVKQPEGVTASVKYLGSKEAFDSQGKWRKVSNVAAATAGLSSNKKSSTCGIL